MYKLLPTILVATALLLSETQHSQTAIARTCTSNCGPPPIQFIPGQRINVEVVNLTTNLVEMQSIPDTDPVAITPGQVVYLGRGGSTEPNLSLMLSDVNGLPLRVNILKPENRTLRIELRPGGRQPRDRTIYLKDDGRVTVF